MVDRKEMVEFARGQWGVHASKITDGNVFVPVEYMDAQQLAEFAIRAQDDSDLWHALRRAAATDRVPPHMLHHLDPLPRQWADPNSAPKRIRKPGIDAKRLFLLAEELCARFGVVKYNNTESDQYLHAAGIIASALGISDTYAVRKIKEGQNL